MTAHPTHQLSRHNKQLQHLLKPVRRIQEEEAEGISSMVGGRAGSEGCGQAVDGMGWEPSLGAVAWGWDQKLGA